METSHEEERAQEKAKIIHQQNKEKVRAEREKARQEARAREEEEYTKKHNKTVKQVLSQAAKLARKDAEDDSSEENGSEEEEDDESSEQGDGDQPQKPRGDTAGLGKEKSKAEERDRPRKWINLASGIFLFFLSCGSSRTEELE